MAWTGRRIMFFSKVAVLIEVMGISKTDAVESIRVKNSVDGASIIRRFIFLALNHYLKNLM